MNTLSIGAASRIICGAMAKNRVPATIAVALDANGFLHTVETAAELVRLRLLQNAQPAELTEAQTDALADAGNRALNDHYHEDLCHCSDWPESCASSGNYFAGRWDTAAFSIGMAAVIGAWESMRAPAEADEIARLRARVAELEAAAYGDAPVRILEPVAQIGHLRDCVAAQKHRADTLNWIGKEQRQRADAAEARVAELEATQTSFLLPWAHQLDAKSLDNFVGELVQAADAPLLFVVDEIHQAVARWRELVAQQAPEPVRPCGCPARFDRHADGCPATAEEAAARSVDAQFPLVARLLAEDPHDSPLHHAYTTGRDLPDYQDCNRAIGHTDGYLTNCNRHVGHDGACSAATAPEVPSA